MCVLGLTSFIKHDSHELQYLTYHREPIDFNALCEEQFVRSMSCCLVLGKESSWSLNYLYLSRPYKHTLCYVNKNNIVQ